MVFNRKVIMCTRHLSFILLLLLPIILLMSTFSIGMVKSQGMIAIPSPDDTEAETQKAASLPRFTKEKAEIHKKIAASAVEQKKTENLREDDNDADSIVGESDGEQRVSDKIIRKEKDIKYQDPKKHQSEGWLLHFLLEQYSLTETSDSNVEEQVDILQNLEHFAHKFENGRDLFQSTNALKKILLPALNSSYPEIRKAACGVFAVAAQNNAIVQKISMENGVSRRLVHLLSSDLAPSVRSKAIYALSSLLRNHPEAQYKFMNDGGISAVVKGASLSETRKRSLNFITDLLMERKYCRSGSSGYEHEKYDNSERTDSGSNNNNNSTSSDVHIDPCDNNRMLEKSLLANGWCDVLADSLKNIALFENDDQTLITEAISAVVSFCTDTIAEHALILHKLLIKFEKDEESSHTVLLIQQILSEVDPLSLASPKNVKEEL